MEDLWLCNLEEKQAFLGGYNDTDFFLKFIVHNSHEDHCIYPNTF